MNNAMNVTVKELPQTHVAYVRTIGPYQGPSISNAFHKLMRWAGPRGFASNGKTYGVPWDNPEVTAPEKCRYDACVEVPEGTATQGEIGTQIIQGGHYAVYHVEFEGMEGFESSWRDLFQQWLPSSGYEPDEKHCFELYDDERCDPDKQKWVLDICLPVKPL